ncbi:dihydrofolate reductase family protein [Devosia sp. XJ19-1]|uniref:Dihydrofolate reductase family protein n=1 Tax=Devosia ureilytica TaxID=2952754 RepID=A0A9Q4FS36_9HYPH|nr:dihydrofolate reductase family protein [Devosia ureilytica]MCP8882839.1 dihydrofolate reductase family protein [Devosia ureilytica]MCP8886793.1 dihydrofolate reductase family protein [Devosia ureilytica]
MRKVTAGLFHSVDGVVQDPFKFQFDSFDDQLGEMLTGVQERVDTVLMGRVGWSEWAGYWPNATQDNDFADFINAVPKHVASNTLGAADMGKWSNSSLIDGDVVDFVRNLKSQPGGEIAAMGGISLVRQLLFAGLMDELSLITHPVVAGEGRHLFEPGDPTTRLELVRCDVTSKGNVVQVYRKRAE